MSLLDQIQMSMSRTDKQTNARMVQDSQYGYVDPVYCTEGRNTGLVKSISCTVQISPWKWGNNFDIIDRLLHEVLRSVSLHGGSVLNGPLLSLEGSDEALGDDVILQSLCDLFHACLVDLPVELVNLSQLGFVRVLQEILHGLAQCLDALIGPVVSVALLAYPSQLLEKPCSATTEYVHLVGVPILDGFFFGFVHEIVRQMTEDVFLDHAQHGSLLLSFGLPEHIWKHGSNHLKRVAVALEIDFVEAQPVEQLLANGRIFGDEEHGDQRV